MDTDTQYKNKIGIRITNILMDAFESEKIDKAEMSYLASYILEEMEKAHGSLAVFNFVLRLAKQWPIFSELVTVPASQQLYMESADHQGQL